MVATGLSLPPKSQIITPQADVQLAAADVQLLADQLLAHDAVDAAMQFYHERRDCIPFSQLPWTTTTM